MGCRHPDEHTLGETLATLCAAHYSELPSAKQLYDKLQDLKLCVDIERKPYPYEAPKSYPEKLADLPADIWDFAYAEGGPVDVEIPGISHIVNKIPLRKNSKLLKQELSKQEVKQLKQEFQSAVQHSGVEFRRRCSTAA